MVSHGWRDTGRKAALCTVSKAPLDQPRRREEPKASAATYVAFATTLRHGCCLIPNNEV